MNRCPTEDALILYGSGERDDDVARHVVGCATCLAVVEGIRQLDQALLTYDLDEPDVAFFDDLATGVMDNIEGMESGGGVVELRPALGSTDARSNHRPLALATAAVILLCAALALTTTRQAGETVEVPLVDAEPTIESSIPDEATARALAEELGISLDPIDPAAVAEAEVADVGKSLQTGGLGALVSNLRDTETEALHVGLGDDVFAALAELDVDELAAVLETLES